MELGLKFKIEDLTKHKARLVVWVVLEGETIAGGVSVLSGPKDDILDYVAGEITLGELRRRWEKR